MSQKTLLNGQTTDVENSEDIVYVVVTNYDDDPHPHVEGVFTDKSAAEELRKQCRSVTEPPHPIAWDVIEQTVDESTAP
ncbi:hypothetical protein N3930_41495 [Bacillus thuringiensis]|nr:hypothetical protein [Bacillus thuringiensis]